MTFGTKTPLQIYTMFLFAIILTSVVLVVTGVLAVSKRSTVPGRLQGFFELVTEYFRDIFLGALGHGGEKHLPLIFALFWYILFSNLIELIPGLNAPTSNASNTLALGIIVFFYVQYVGIKARGIGQYLAHFCGPIIFMAPLFFLIEVIGEFIKPFSLGMRLAGNIYAEDVINKMAMIPVGPAAHPAFFIPMQIIVYPLQIFTGVIQAAIFPLLTCAYINLMSETHNDNGDDYDSHPHSETMTEKLSESIGSHA